MQRNQEDTVVDVPVDSVNVKLITQNNGTTSTKNQTDIASLLQYVGLKNLQLPQSSSTWTAQENDIPLFRGKFGNINGFNLDHEKNTEPIHLTSLVYRHPNLIESVVGSLITASKTRHGNNLCCFPTSAVAFQEIKFATMGDEMPFLTAKLPTLNICPCCKTNKRTVEISSPHFTNQIGSLQISDHIRYNVVIENNFSSERFIFQMANPIQEPGGHGPVRKIVNERTNELVAVAHAIMGIENRIYKWGVHMASEYKWKKFQLIYVKDGMSGVDKALFLMAACTWVVEMKEENRQVNCRARLCILSVILLCAIYWFYYLFSR